MARLFLFPGFELRVSVLVHRFALNIPVVVSAIVRHKVLAGSVRFDVSRRYGRFAGAPGDIQYVLRLTEPGDAAAQVIYQALSGRDVGAEVRGAASPVT